MTQSTKKLILDACCGGRMFWFDKNHPNAIYIDKRMAPKGHIPSHPNHSVDPDVVMDFRDLKFKNSQFGLVVFDPPHFYGIGTKSWLAKKYGVLDKETWQLDIKQGFDECWRVLKKGGTMIVKWSEDLEHPSRMVTTTEFIKLVQRKPLFGHRTGTRSNTHWLCYMKI